MAVAGCGEHVMKTLLARECAHCLQSDEWAEHGLRDTLKNKFLGIVDTIVLANLYIL